MLGVFGIYGLVPLILVWTHLNVLQVDAAGHIASAAGLQDGMFHRFDDRFFLGYVQNLFYPPLEDALIAVLGFFSGDILLGYKLYLSALIIAYLAAILHFSIVFRKMITQIFFLMAMMILISLEKYGADSFQGLSFPDILITGLTAEVLGAVFSLVLFRRLVDGEGNLTLLLVLTILSHLVMGPIAVFTVLVFAVLQKRWSLLKDVGFALWVSMFFLGPMLLYREALFSSTIFRPLPYFLIIFLVYAAVMLAPGRRPYLPFAVVGICLVLPQELNSLTGKLFDFSLFPPYHYYRLGMPALLMLVIACAGLIEEKIEHRSSSYLRYATVILLAFFLLRDFEIHGYDLDSPAYGQQNLETVDLGISSETPSRTFVIHDERPCDFYVDALLVSQGSDALFNKGLYWESSRNNVLLSSYLATVLDRSSLVLDYWYYQTSSCRELSCFLDHFIAANNLGFILVGDLAEVSYLDRERQGCYQTVLSLGTEHFVFERLRTVHLGDDIYGLYAVHSESNGLSNAGVEVVQPEDLAPVDLSAGAWLAKGPIEDTILACRERTANRRIYLEEEALEALEEDLAGWSAPAAAEAVVEWRRRGSGRYEIFIDHDEPVLFAVKLNAYPGFELQDSAGKPIELYEGLGVMVARGHGRMELVWRRPLGMKLCYAVTAMALVVGAGRGWRRRRRHHPSPARSAEDVSRSG